MIFHRWWGKGRGAGEFWGQSQSFQGEKMRLSRRQKKNGGLLKIDCQSGKGGH